MTDYHEVAMLYKNKNFVFSDFVVERDQDKCIKCLACVNQCSFDANYHDKDQDLILSYNDKCVGCHRCEAFCPTDCIIVKLNPRDIRPNYNWNANIIKGIYKQANASGALLGAMGNPQRHKIYWDRILLDACQVTNPSIDPLREPMELRTYLGRKPEKLEFQKKDTGKISLKTEIAPQLKLEIPVMFAAMSYGALNLRVHQAMAKASEEMGTYFNTGEGGLYEGLYPYGKNTIVQVASGRFGVHNKYLDVASAVEIKIGQGAKPGIGGHLPGKKVTPDVSKTRMIPVGSDALSPAPHHDIYSIEDLRQLIFAIKEAVDYSKPVIVKISAVHNAAAIASGIARAGADIIVIDGYKGGTGASPEIVRDNTGIPIELALASVDERLRQEGIREQVSLVVSGGIRNAGDVVKAICLGADACYIGTAALIAVGCTMCQQCHTGKCAWGITTNDPVIVKRINTKKATEQLVNLLKSWDIEIKEVIGSMGLNAIESMRGSRERLRGIDLNELELETLGIKLAGR